MADKWTKGKRSAVMARIRATHTLPEVTLRSALHRLGYRFSLHRSDLPGKPDLVLVKYGVVVFVHGCFWHQHPGCIDGRMPKSRQDYWRPKLQRNIARHGRAQRLLRSQGWRV